MNFIIGSVTITEELPVTAKTQNNPNKGFEQLFFAKLKQQKKKLFKLSKNVFCFFPY